DGTTVNVTVSRQTSNLTEVVVTSLGIQRQAKELGYATAKVNNKELTQAKVIDVSTGLQGKVSGLQVNLTNNGVDPATRIVLRGNRSITGNNQALIVLDGFPIDDVSYINKINPEDIESVNVLKGAVAAAIYGSKASNGVLVITTKHGTRGKPTITVSNTLNLESVSYMPNLQNSFTSYGGEGAYTNANGTTEYVPYENQSYGPRFDGTRVPLAIKPNLAPDGVTVLSWDTLFNTNSARPNEKKDFFNTGITNQFDVAYSSGDERGTFYLGFQDASIAGVTPKDASRRDNIRLNGSRDYGRFKAEYSASYNQRTDNIVGLSYNQTSGGVFSGRPIYFELVNAPAGAPINSFKDWQNDVYASPDGYYNAYATNPYWTIDNSRRKQSTYDLFGNVNLSFRLTSWLNISDRAGIVQTTRQRTYTRAGITFAPWAIADPWSAGNIPSSLKSLKPSVYDESFLEQRLNNDLLAAFDKTFGDISIKGVVGWNFGQRYQRTVFLQGDNLQFPGFYNISSVLGTPGYGESSFKQRETAVYEEVTLGFKDFLYLHLSNRDEWNSVLDPSQQHYEYPGVDVSFIFSQAIGAFKNSKLLSFGKLRGGYTQVANINLGGTPYGAYSLVNPFNPAGGFPFGNLGGYSQSTTYLNPLIKPEKTTAAEVGLELGFLQNRINFQAAYYNSVTTNQTLTAQLSAGAGFTSKVVNAGKVTNNGIELDLNVTVIKNKDWTWTVGANYAHYQNKVNELLPGVDELQLSGLNGGVSGGIYAIKGLPYPVIKTSDWTRDSATGKVIVDPVTGRPSYDPTNKIYGNTNPTDILGIKTTLQWKNFTFGAVLDYRGGNSIINTIGTQLDFTGVSAHSAENGRQRFIFPNSVVLQGGKYVNNTTVAVNNGGNIGGAGFWPDIYTSGIGSVYVTSAAFWKLREVSLSYTLPAVVLAKTKFIRGATIGLVGRNLLMIRPKSNIWTDPEFSDTNGNDVGRTSEFQLPPTRMYGANITLTF
ncbi:MAG TPA: SusC/RagA family TonB-linked outer membrane protein, partial [Puia sp.]|nr:SusC/RagA family TonB-linked outer membrane protein [Puia sp.]